MFYPHEKLVILLVLKGGLIRTGLLNKLSLKEDELFSDNFIYFSPCCLEEEQLRDNSREPKTLVYLKGYHRNISPGNPDFHCNECDTASYNNT